jgi:large subunit ribosomal protein L4
MAAILKAVKCDNASLLVGIATADPKVHLATRNIDKVEISPVDQLNAWSVLKPKRLLLTKGALDAIKKQAEAVPKSRKAKEAAAAK